MLRLSKTFIWFLTLLGLALFGYGLIRERFDLREVLGLIVMVLWPLAIFLILGLVLLFWSIEQARRVDPNKAQFWPIQMIVSIFFLFLVVGSLSLNWKSIFHHFSSDQTDEARLAQLANAKLDSFSSQPLAGGPGETAGDWPQWRGPHRDGKSAETGINTDWQQSPPPTLWRRKLGGGYSSISVVGDRLYTMDRQGDQERVVCLATDTGKDLWAVAYSIDFSNIGYNAGPRATPTIVDRQLYSLGITGIFLALELPGMAAGQPKELWRHDLIAEFDATLPTWGVACSPLVDGDLVIVQPGGSKGSVAAFNRHSGALVWAALSDQNGYSSPVVAELAGQRQVIAFTGEGVAGLDVRDGKKLWYYDWPEQFRGNIATPIVASNFVFISSAYSNGGCALLEITSKDGGFQAHPVYTKHNKFMSNHHSTCILHEGCLYGFDKDLFKCVDLRTAKEKWVNRKPGKGCLTFADGHLIILSERGELTIAPATPEKCTLLGKLDLFDRAETWAVPVLSRGRLFVRDKEEILCLDLRKSVKQ